MQFRWIGDHVFFYQTPDIPCRMCMTAGACRMSRDVAGLESYTSDQFVYRLLRTTLDWQIIPLVWTLSLDEDHLLGMDIHSCERPLEVPKPQPRGPPRPKVRPIRDPLKAGRDKGALLHGHLLPTETLQGPTEPDVSTLPVEFNEDDHDLFVNVPPDVKEDLEFEEDLGQQQEDTPPESPAKSDDSGSDDPPSDHPPPEPEDEPPPPPPLDPRPHIDVVERKRVGPAGDWIQINFDGGFLKYSKRLRRCDAHCTRPDHGGASKCKMDKSMKRCRPIARAIAWLVVGDAELCPTRKDHTDLKKDIGGPLYYKIRLEARQMVYGFAASNPILRAMLEDEDDPGVHEHREVK